MRNEDVIADLRKKIASISDDAPIEKPAAEAIETDESERAFKKLMDLVNISDRSEKAMRERLKKDGFEDLDIDVAIDRALSYGFIDDMRFADVLIRSRISQGKGSAGIERELAGHDIDINDVPGWPNEYEIDSEIELDRALSFLDRKPPRSKNQREGAFRKLVQRGFSTSVASSAARIWSERSED